MTELTEKFNQDRTLELKTLYDQYRNGRRYSYDDAWAEFSRNALLLVERGADVNAAPLIDAALDAHDMKFLDYLIEKNADAEPSLKVALTYRAKRQGDYDTQEGRVEMMTVARKITAAFIEQNKDDPMYIATRLYVEYASRAWNEDTFGKLDASKNEAVAFLRDKLNPKYAFFLEAIDGTAGRSDDISRLQYHVRKPKRDLTLG